MYRHLNVIYVSEFLKQYDVSANTIGIIEFYSSYYQDFMAFVKEKQFSDVETELLVPESMRGIVPSQKDEFLQAIAVLEEKVNACKDDYYDSNDNEKKVLDVFLEEGIFPTYSFPRNVVGFSIEDSKGKKVDKECSMILVVAI